MAYMTQTNKAELAPAIKVICAKYGMKARLSVNNHSTLVLNISAGKIDLLANFNSTSEVRRSSDGTPGRKAEGYLQVNEFWFKEHFTGQALDFLTEVIAAMNVGNHDRSDSQSDYYDVGWYISVNVGQWDKHYQLIA